MCDVFSARRKLNPTDVRALRMSGLFAGCSFSRHDSLKMKHPYLSPAGVLQKQRFGAFASKCSSVLTCSEANEKREIKKDKRRSPSRFAVTAAANANAAQHSTAAEAKVGTNTNGEAESEGCLAPFQSTLTTCVKQLPKKTTRGMTGWERLAFTLSPYQSPGVQQAHVGFAAYWQWPRGLGNMIALFSLPHWSINVA